MPAHVQGPGLLPSHGSTLLWGRGQISRGWGGSLGPAPRPPAAEKWMAGLPAADPARPARGGDGRVGRAGLLSLPGGGRSSPRRPRCQWQGTEAGLPQGDAAHGGGACGWADGPLTLPAASVLSVQVRLCGLPGPAASGGRAGTQPVRPQGCAFSAESEFKAAHKLQDPGRVTPSLWADSRVQQHGFCLLSSNAEKTGNAWRQYRLGVNHNSLAHF